MRLGRAFITYDSLREVWTEQKDSGILSNIGLTDEEAIHVGIKLLRTFSILVVMRWDEWHKFSGLFLQGRDCRSRSTDEEVMKLSSADLEQCLGRSWASNFQNWIAAFNPIIIEFGKIMACEKNMKPSSSGHSEYVQVPDGARLPFLLNQSGSQLGRGGYGTVTRETIPSGQFLDKARERNIRAKVIARKCFTDKVFFDAERVVMSLLVKGLLKHENILYPLAMISLESEYSILMDVADCNLDDFLKEEGRMDSTISLKSLLKQVESLAHALSSLHKADTSAHIIHHLDLTPRNVLVKLSGGPDNPGTWMLSDFGRSKHYFNRATAESGADSVQGGPQVNFSERTSTYLPQEKERGSYTDVWSLGCILCLVVCRKRHGIEGLRLFDELRSKDDPAGNDYFYRGTTVNPYVTRLLNQFCASGCKMTEKCGNLLNSVLSMDKNKRPKAWNLYDDLECIARNCEESTHTVIPLQIDSPGPQIPLDTSQSFTDPDQSLLRTQTPGNLVDRSPNPVFLAIKNQGEDHALVQIESLFCGSIRGYSSIEQYDKGLTPLCHAAKKGYTKVVKFLRGKGAQVDERDKRGNTPLMYACKKGHCETAEYLIDHGADWNLQGEDGYTCLHFATENKKLGILDVFIQKQPSGREKLNANLLNDLDRTPLELNLYRNYRQAPSYELTQKLISLGANARAHNDRQNHKTAVRLAEEKDDQQAIQILNL
ncbi:hypothetical protein BDV11DRAFT_172728 [Aspergillus similis]